MSEFYYHPQVPDSVQTPLPASEAAVARQDTATDLQDTGSGFFVTIPLDELRKLAEAATATPEITIGTPVKRVDRQVETVTGWNSGRNFFLENGLSGIVSGIGPDQAVLTAPVAAVSVKPVGVTPLYRFQRQQDWLLGIFLLLTLLFIWIRIFYGKFFSTLANALISFQISAKLFREKNVLLHRVSIVLDFIYILVLSVFIFEVAVHFGLVEAEITPFNLFLIFLNIAILYTLLRIAVLRITGNLFQNRSTFMEYIHNTFVINKGTGIALFPVVIMAHYLPESLVEPVIVLGMMIFAAAFIFKGIRAYQIIIRKDIILFYLILYFCTLEILPLLLGFKFVISLI
jgi:hypothetical protein